MREIKFRGKTVEGAKLWKYGSFLAPSNAACKPLIYEHLSVPTRDGNGYWYEVDELTVGQFTGLFDCEGKEIYEGDVVRHENCICLVVYNSTRFASFALRKDGWAFDHYFGEAFEASECQVIGNIHDTPGLLEAKNARD